MLSNLTVLSDQTAGNQLVDEIKQFRVTISENFQMVNMN